MHALAIAPTFQEAANIEEFLSRMRRDAPTVDVLVVDDNSPDGTADIAEKVARELGGIEVLRRPAKRGLGSAYRAGFAVGIARGYDVLLGIDSDLSHDPAVVPELIAALERGADMAIGSRYVPGGSIPHWPWHRRALSRYGNAYTGYMLRVGVADATSGFRAFRASWLADVDYASTRSKGYGFQIELAYRVVRHGGTVTEVPITFTDRVRGTSKMSLAVMVEEMVLVSWWGIRDRLRACRVSDTTRARRPGSRRAA